jgi:23S rRNA (cytosine1962-C5)-methyltransferase
MSKARLRVRLTATAESIVRSGHPWIFANSIREQNREGDAGELAVIYDRQDRFLAIGLFDPGSVLRIRVLHAGKPVTVDDAWWQARLQTTVAKRDGILDEHTTACRLIHGESDGWPGLVVDRYEQVLVLKLYTAVWAPRIDLLVSLFRQAISPESIVLRLSRNVQAAFAECGQHDGQVIFGAPVKAPVVFRETGIRFEADVVAGQKTGFFLDQRENRRVVETLARDAEMLNAFSFSGGFSLYGARGGARSVTDLDISAHALASAERNFELNRDVSSIAPCRHEMIQANAFDWLHGNPGRLFDLIVLDPPSLAKRETERAVATRAYEKLAASALTHLRPGGRLVAASCSAHVSAEEFFEAVRRAAAASRRKFAMLKTTRHAPDHPAAFPEAEYLKCIYLRLEP